MHVLITPMKDANDDYMLATDSVIPCLQTLCRFKDGIKFVAGKIMRLALLLASTDHSHSAVYAEDDSVAKWSMAGAVR